MQAHTGLQIWHSSTVDDFLETIEHENGAIEIREKKNVENTLEKFVETKKNFKKEQSDPLVEVQNLTVRFRSSKGFLGKKNRRCTCCGWY